MRVALVCPYSWDRPGGVQSHIRSLARVLRARGHDVLIVAPRSGRTADEPGVAIVGRAVAIPANGSVATLAFGPRAAARIKTVLSSFAPDVIHLHEPLIPSLSLLALWETNIPAVGTFHAAAEHSAGYRIARPVLARAAARLTVRTAVSDAARALVGRYLPGEYQLTPNGVDVAGFSDASPADLGPGRKVLFLGRIERRKGLEVLIQAMTRLRDLDAELIVAGAGPREKEERALAARVMVPARWLGRVTDAEKAALFARADAYSAPALGGESFGIVLIESMAAGTPVVCSDLPGFRAVATGAAVLVTPGDPGLLADGLRRVLTDEGLAHRMRAAGSRIAGGFSWERLVGNVEVIYGRAVEAHANAAR